MPPPAAPADLTITYLQEGSPEAELEWTHPSAGSVHSFQLLYKPQDAEDWISYLIAPKADFGAGPYSIEVVSPPFTEWAVAALNAAGQRSV